MKILLAEGDDLMRGVIGELLKSDCFEILEARAGETAIGIAQMAMPVLIITSLRLQDMNGFELIKSLKGDRLTKSIPIIVLTGDTLPAAVTRATELGAAAFLAKPGGLDKLLSTVSRVLDVRAHPSPHTKP